MGVLRSGMETEARPRMASVTQCSVWITVPANGDTVHLRELWSSWTSFQFFGFEVASNVFESFDYISIDFYFYGAVKCITGTSTQQQ